MDEQEARQVEATEDMWSLLGSIAFRGEIPEQVYHEDKIEEWKDLQERIEHGGDV